MAPVATGVRVRPAASTSWLGRTATDLMATGSAACTADAIATNAVVARSSDFMDCPWVVDLNRGGIGWRDCAQVTVGCHICDSARGRSGGAGAASPGRQNSVQSSDLIAALPSLW